MLSLFSLERQRWPYCCLTKGIGKVYVMSMFSEYFVTMLSGILRESNSTNHIAIVEESQARSMILCCRYLKPNQGTKKRGKTTTICVNDTNITIISGNSNHLVLYLQRTGQTRRVSASLSWSRCIAFMGKYTSR